MADNIHVNRKTHLETTIANINDRISALELLRDLAANAIDPAQDPAHVPAQANFIARHQATVDEIAQIQAALPQLHIELAAVTELENANKLTMVVPVEDGQPMAANQPYWRDIFTICKPLGNQPLNYRSMFSKLFGYGIQHHFTHDTYKACIGNILDGEANLEFQNKEQLPLQQIVDHFLTINGSIDSPQEACHEMTRFSRRSNENIKACMQRYRSLLERAMLVHAPPLPNAAGIMPQNNFDPQMLECLFKNVGPLTKAALDHEKTICTRNNQFISLPHFLEVAFHAELANGERGPIIYPNRALADQFAGITLHNVEVENEFEQQVNAVPLRKPPPPAYVKPNNYIKQEPNTTRGRNVSVSANPPQYFRQQSRSPGRSSQDVKPILTNSHVPRSPTPSPAISQAIVQNLPNAPVKIEHPRAYTPEGNRISYEVKPFQQPGTIPASMDQNSIPQFAHYYPPVNPVAYRRNDSYSGPPPRSMSPWRDRQNSYSPMPQYRNNRSNSQEFRNYQNSQNFRDNSGYDSRFDSRRQRFPSNQRNERFPSNQRQGGNFYNPDFQRRRNQSQSPNRFGNSAKQWL